jgi:uncharacterized protein (TIGR03067 family)
MSALLLSLTLLGAAAEVQTRETPTTRLFVQTSPPGAAIKLDGKAEGTAPKVFLVPPDANKMVVEVELDGHASQRREVEIQGGRVTRIEFQLAPQQAKSPTSSSSKPQDPEPPANRDWPDVERILYTGLSGKECGIDLDMGKLYALPKEYNRVVYPRDEIVRWASDHQIDLFYPAKPGSAQLTCAGLGLRALDNTTWEKVTREDIHDFFIRLGTGKMEVPETMSPLWADYTTGAAPSYVYAFVTNEGTKGIVQMVGTVGGSEKGSPSGVRIRYKIERPAVKPSADKASTISPAAELKALQAEWKVMHVEKGENAGSTWPLMDPPFHKDSMNPENIDRLQITEGELALLDHKKGQRFVARYRVNPTTTPGRIDLVTSEGFGEERKERIAAVGIYEVGGDRLKVCLAQYHTSLEAEQRPKGFAVVRGSADVLFTLERYRLPQTAGEDLQAIQGKWEMVAQVEDGKAASGIGKAASDVGREGIFSFSLAFSHEQCSFDFLRRGRGHASSAVFDLDPAQQPKAITIFSIPLWPFDHIGSDPAQPKQGLCGIYRLEGDKLTIAYRQGGPRPGKFESAPGSGVTLLTFRKAGVGGTGSVRPVIVEFDFAFNPWREVVESLAKQMGLSAEATSLPSGTFNYRAPR